MADKGIIFSGPMVRALLDGRKTQTRRLLRNPENYGCPTGDCPHNVHAECNAHMAGLTAKEVGYAPGDRLYVRESWYCDHMDCQRGPYVPPDAMGHEQLVEDGWLHFMATNDPNIWEAGQPSWKPSIHMPRWASRLWLAVTDVRVQRLQDISEEDARAESCAGALGLNPDFPDEWDPLPSEEFRDLWNSLHTKPGERWADNPWIVAITFEVHHGNIDAGASANG